ncbi:hypothetical protein ACFY9F_36300 [Streptomyces sp. NPDC012421]
MPIAAAAVVERAEQAAAGASESEGGRETAEGARRCARRSSLTA